MSHLDETAMRTYMALTIGRNPVTAQTIARRAKIRLNVVEKELRHMEMLALVTWVPVTGWQRNAAWKPGPIPVDLATTRPIGDS